MKPLIIRKGCDIAQKFGYGSAIHTLLVGFSYIFQKYSVRQETGFDVIIANDYESARKAIQIKKKTNKPLIASIHLSQEMPEEKELIAECDGIIVYSNLMKNFMRLKYPTCTKPIEVVQMGINSNAWKLGRCKRRDFALFVGRSCSPNKNFLPFMKHCLDEQIDFRLAGDRDTKAKFNLGYLSMHELHKTYQRAALHVLPSSFDPFGLVTLEAMACGCPVAVSTQAGVSELLNDDVAILFDPDEPYSIKDFMKRAKKFDSKKISAYARQFNHIAHAKSFMNAVYTLLQKHAKGAIDEELKLGDYEHFPCKDRVVFDIGAFMGETACLFSKRGAKRVYAIEPFNSFNRIAQTAKENGCANIIPIRAALGEFDDIKRIEDVPNNGATRFDDHIQKPYAVTKGIDVKVVSLETLLNAVPENDVFVKIDCEGAESSILRTSRKALGKVKYFIIEVHAAKKRDLALALGMLLAKNNFKIKTKLGHDGLGMIYAQRGRG